jgi:hypothetical protein
MGILRRGTESFLPDRDYLPLAMPTTALDVLWLLTREGGALRRFGALTDVLVNDNAMPNKTVTRGSTVAASSGSAWHTFKAGVSLGVVNSLLHALGAEAKADISLTGARSVNFSYVDVRSDDVNVARLDGWLHAADLSASTPRIAELLVAERLYVVLGALRAGGLAVSLRDEKGAELGVDLSSLQQAVGVNVALSGSGGRSSQVVFQGSSPLVVAAKVAQLKAEPEGFWVSERLITDGEIRDIGEADYLDGDEIRLQ